MIWVISAILILVSLYIILGNLWIAFGGAFKKRKAFVSFIPVVGGLAGMFGLLICPVHEVHRFWWLPLLLDLGFGPMLVGAIIEWIKNVMARKRHSK